MGTATTVELGPAPSGPPMEFVHLERHGATARVVLDRPPLNVLHIPMLEELDRALSAAAEDPSIKVLLLCAVGRAFCAGVDVADHTVDRVDRMLAVFHAVIRRLLRLECPVVGVVRGAALGGGCELLMACDLVLAHEDARIGQPEIKLGAFPPAAAALLPRLVGRKAALGLILTGRPLSAAEARDLGLVTEVFSHDVFDAAVREYAGEIAASSGPVLRLAKRTVQECHALPIDTAISHAEEVYLGELMRLADAHEGLAAFMEKRPPTWRDQ